MGELSREVASGLGDCYEAAASTIIGTRGNAHGLTDDNAEVLVELTLVHAMVYHEAVGWHGHAWLEVENAGVVLELSRGQQLVLARDDYYAAGQVKDVHRYNVSEAADKTQRYGHWGPWEGEEGVGPLIPGPHLTKAYEKGYLSAATFYTCPKCGLTNWSMLEAAKKLCPWCSGAETTKQWSRRDVAPGEDLSEEILREQ